MAAIRAGPAQARASRPPARSRGGQALARDRCEMAHSPPEGRGRSGGYVLFCFRAHVCFARGRGEKTFGGPRGMAQVPNVYLFCLWPGKKLWGGPPPAFSSFAWVKPARGGVAVVAAAAVVVAVIVVDLWQVFFVEGFRRISGLFFSGVRKVSGTPGGLRKSLEAPRGPRRFACFCIFQRFS